MGNKAAIALFTVSGVLVLFSVYASLLPDVLASKTSIEIQASNQDVARYLGKAKNWEEWLFSAETKKDGWRILTSGKDSAEGSVLKWFSELEGDGGLEIKRLSFDTIVFERISDNNAFRDRGYLFLETTDSVTQITFLDSLDISTNFVARYNAQDTTYLEKINMENQSALRRLKYKL